MFAWIKSLWTGGNSRQEPQPVLYNSYSHEELPSGVLPFSGRVKDPIAVEEIEHTRALLREVQEAINRELKSLEDEVSFDSAHFPVLQENTTSNKFQINQIFKTKKPKSLTPTEKWEKLKKQQKKLMSKRRAKMSTITPLTGEQKEIVHDGMKLNQSLMSWERIDAQEEDESVKEVSKLGFPVNGMRQAPEGWRDTRIEFIITEKIRNQWKRSHENHKQLSGWLIKESNSDNRSFLDNARRLAIKKLVQDASNYSGNQITTSSAVEPTNSELQKSNTSSHLSGNWMRQAPEVQIGPASSTTQKSKSGSSAGKWMRQDINFDTETQLGPASSTKGTYQIPNLYSTDDVQHWNSDTPTRSYSPPRFQISDVQKRDTYFPLTDSQKRGEKEKIQVYEPLRTEEPKDTQLEKWEENDDDDNLDFDNDDDFHRKIQQPNNSTLQSPASRIPPVAALHTSVALTPKKPFTSIDSFDTFSANPKIPKQQEQLSVKTSEPLSQWKEGEDDDLDDLDFTQKQKQSDEEDNSNYIDDKQIDSQQQSDEEDNNDVHDTVEYKYRPDNLDINDNDTSDEESNEVNEGNTDNKNELSEIFSIGEPDKDFDDDAGELPVYDDF